MKTEVAVSELQPSTTQAKHSTDQFEIANSPMRSLRCTARSPDMGYRAGVGSESIAKDQGGNFHQYRDRVSNDLYASLSVSPYLLTTWTRLAASGGTVDSLMAESSLDPQTYKESRRPWALSPVEGSQPSMSTSALGLRRDPVLGLLSASSFSFGENRALVHRTWGLLSSTDQAYGPNFQYYEFDKVSSTFAGLSRILNTALLAIMLKISLLRTIAKLFFPKPGEGPDVEKSRRSRTKFEAVAIAEPNGDSNPPRAYASFSYPSGGYHTTAVVLAEGAASLLYTRRLEGGYKGGCLTPAFLGDDLLRRIQAAGVVFKVHMV